MSSKNQEHAITMDKGPDPKMVSSLRSNPKISPVYTKLKNSISEAKKPETQGARNERDRSKAVPKIQMVPAVLREQKEFEKYYEPRWISIGPVHHGHPRLTLAESHYKMELASKFVSESGSEIESVYASIRTEIENLKSFFHEDAIAGFEDETLAWLLFLDGSCVLQLIKSYVRNELGGFSIKTEHIAYAQQDLFLLENQVPFEVLKLLMGRSEKREEIKESIREFIRCNVMAPNKYTTNLRVEIDGESEPAHLLELLRWAIIQPPKASRQCCDIKGCFKGKKNFRKNQGQPSFRSVQDLVSAGVDLKPSESCSLLDITFTSLFFYGMLKLPPVTVDDLTGSKFLNLIAYEMCPDNFRTNYEVTTYISLLDSLIDYPNDVKELRSAHVLHNLLGCDKDVAQLFNKIATNLVPSPVYDDVLAEVESHYTSKWRTWMAQVYHEHFRTPWTIVAFLAAAVALILSGVQTWYTINPRNEQPQNSKP